MKLPGNVVGSGYIALHDSHGDELWSYNRVRPDGGLYTRVDGAAFDDEGNIIVAGVLNFCPELEEGLLYVAKYRTDGERIWASVHRCGVENSPGCHVFDVAAGPSGEVIIAGFGGGEAGAAKHPLVLKIAP